MVPGGLLEVGVPILRLGVSPVNQYGTLSHPGASIKDIGMIAESRGKD
jgi:hypothetical protein